MEEGSPECDRPVELPDTATSFIVPGPFAETETREKHPCIGS